MAVKFSDFYDAELARHNKYLEVAMETRPRDRVLDIGCGAGQTTRQAARAAVDGNVLGIDISAEMLATARQRCAGPEWKNIVFEQGDAQTHAFPVSSFDLCISRFGVMFFNDPVAAFANIGQAMRPGARIVWLVWQSQERNEWSTAIRRTLAPESAVSAETTAAFSLAEPDSTTDLLRTAGFESICFAGVHEPVYYGPNVDAALDALSSFQFVKNALAQADAPDRSVQRLREMLEDHLTTKGVFFESAAWLITAYRASETRN